MSNKRNRNNFIKVNGFIKQSKKLGVVLKKEHLEGCTMNDVFIANFCHNGVLSGADEAPNRKEAE